MKRHALTIYAVLYALLVFYGSLMPFDLSNDDWQVTELSGVTSAHITGEGVTTKVIEVVKSLNRKQVAALKTSAGCRTASTCSKTCACRISPRTACSTSLACSARTTRSWPC